MATDVTCLQCGKPYDASLVANRFAGVCPACLAKFAADNAGDVEQSPGIADPAMKPPLNLGGTFHGLEIMELLGAGGMGVVYKARQPGLDRHVALKVLSPKLTSDPEFVARFNREAKAMAALNHPGIVQVFDYGRDGDLCYLVMEFVDGQSLRDLMKSTRLPPEEALKVVPKICEALGYAHSKGVIHRDIKPENILVDRDGRVKIADFGLARILSGEGVASVTVSRVVMGTPGYMAPEQYQGMKVDHRADIYSLGAVFYEMLTGEVPIGRFEAPSSRVQVDVRLDEIVLKSLATRPEQRYQRAVDVQTDVEAVAKSPPPLLPTPARKEPAGHLWLFVALILVAVLILSVTVLRGKIGAPELLILFVVVVFPAAVIHVARRDSRRLQRDGAPRRTSRLALSALLTTAMSYTPILMATTENPPIHRDAQIAIHFFLQFAAIAMAIAALFSISRSGDRLTGRLYAYAAVFLTWPPVGQVGALILAIIFQRRRRGESPAGEADESRTSKLAIASAVLGVTGASLFAAAILVPSVPCLFLGLVVCLIGLGLALGAMPRIRSSQGRLRGFGLATSALALILVASGGAFIGLVTTTRQTHVDAWDGYFGPYWDRVLMARPPSGWYDTATSEGPNAGSRSVEGKLVPNFSGEVRQRIQRARFLEAAAGSVIYVYLVRFMERETGAGVMAWFVQLEEGRNPDTVLVMRKPVPGESVFRTDRFIMGVFAEEPDRGSVLAERLAGFYGGRFAEVEMDRSSEVR